MRCVIPCLLGSMLCAAATSSFAAGAPVPATSSSAEAQLFIRQAAIGTTAEVEFGRIARQKARNPAVRQLGASVESEAGRYLSRMSGARAAAGLDADLRELRAELEALPNDDFDAAYVTAQIQLYQRAISLMEWQVGFGGDGELTRYACTMLPVVARRLEEARRLQVSLGLPSDGNEMEASLAAAPLDSCPAP